MKRTIIILFFLNALSSFSQTTFMFLNAETNEPMDGICFNIYKNDNLKVNCGCSNQHGYDTQNILEIDSVAKYQFSVNNVKYELIWKEIDVTKHDTLIVKVKRDDYYIGNCDSLFMKTGSHYEWGKYSPREIRSLDDIPENIAIKVNEYLNERVGHILINDFKLVGGQIAELDKAKEYLPSLTRKAVYYLELSYRNLGAGISMYASNLELDEKGNTVKDIQFPVVPNYTNPFKIYSYQEIKKKALQEGFYFPRKTRIDIEYNSEENILLWNVINVEYSTNNTYKQKNTYYNAHNGEYIGEKINKGLWVAD
jgi:hypothetical protein